MTADCILSIDNGTQSVRALIIDSRGNVIAKSRVPITLYTSTAPGLTELDPEIFWKSVCQACQELWSLHGVKKESIAAVALTTQRSTVINLDRQGSPLRPAIIWLDQRRTAGLRPVKGIWGLLFLLSGMKDTVNYLQAEAEANWIRVNQPDIWAKTNKFLFLSGYLTYRLTNRFVDSIGCQVGYVPFDYKAQTWSKRWDWKWQAVPMDKSMLPDLVQPTFPLGEITSEAADATGIPKGLPLIAAAADKACEVIGSGCLTPDVACLSFGSAATINTTHSRYIEVIPMIPPYPSALPNAYSLEIQIYRGYWMVNWFKQEFAQSEERLAKERGIAAEELLDKLIESVPAGAMGLTLQPYWSPGLKIPGPEAKGCIIGFGDVHTRSHIYRSIVEGLGYALREGAERMQKSSNIPIQEVRAAGGGSQSNAAMQITADIFGKPAGRPHLYEASALGAAIDAAVGVGIHPDFPAAIAEMTRTGRIFEPDQGRHKIYDELYNHVYLKMYKKLRSLYLEIQKITGYPATL